MEGWGKKREIHQERDPLRERNLFEWKKEWSTDLWERDINLSERERERETDLREKKVETFGFDFEQNWEIERADRWVMNEEQRW